MWLSRPYSETAELTLRLVEEWGPLPWKIRKNKSWRLRWTLKDEMNFERNRLEKMFPDGDKAMTPAEGANPGGSALVPLPKRPQSSLSPRRPESLVNCRPLGGSVCLWGTLPALVGLQELEIRMQRG